MGWMRWGTNIVLIGKQPAPLRLVLYAYETI